jgi:hypothetical protein
MSIRRKKCDSKKEAEEVEWFFPVMMITGVLVSILAARGEKV